MWPTPSTWTSQEPSRLSVIDERLVIEGPSATTDEFNCNPSEPEYCSPLALHHDPTQLWPYSFLSRSWFRHGCWFRHRRRRDMDDGPPEAHKYGFGDQGGITAAVNDEETVDVVTYSTGLGKTWYAHSPPPLPLAHATGYFI